MFVAFCSKAQTVHVVATLSLVSTHLRCVLVNIFAGITELGEFAELLLRAIDRGADLRVPFVVRLVGNGQDRADEILRAAARADLILERDLDRALDRCREACNA